MLTRLRPVHAAVVQAIVIARRCYAVAGIRRKSRIKVCIIGADSSVGAPLAMLLLRSRYIDDIALYGRRRPERLAAELTCLPERPTIQAFGSEDGGLYCALTGAQLVILAEAAFRSGAMKREDHFQMHVKAACQYGQAIGEEVPTALVGVLTSPISAMMPVVWECVRRSGGRQPERRVMGVAELPAARAAAQTGRTLNGDPSTLKIYVGGSAESNAVPLLSAMPLAQRPTQLESSAIMGSVSAAAGRVRRALQNISAEGHTPCRGDMNDKEDCDHCAYGGHTSLGMYLPTYSIAHAATKFVDAAVRAVSGHRCVETNAFIVTDVTKYNAHFETMPVTLGRHGVLNIHPFPTPSEWESSLLESAREVLREDLKLAREFLTLEYGPSERPDTAKDCPETIFGVGTASDACPDDFFPEPSYCNRPVNPCDICERKEE